MDRTSAQLLRSARARAGLTQAQMAARAGVTQSVISAYENGHREPALSTLLRLVRAAGLDLAVTIDARPMLRLRRLVHERKSELVSALENRGASNVRLFGSVARGEEQAGSDVDLLIDLRDGVGLFALAGMTTEAERILGVPVDVVPAGSLKPSVAPAALADAVAL